VVTVAAVLLLMATVESASASATGLSSSSTHGGYSNSRSSSLGPRKKLLACLPNGFPCVPVLTKCCTGSCSRGFCR
jgi:hypothetical protein